MIHTQTGDDIAALIRESATLTISPDTGLESMKGMPIVVTRRSWKKTDMVPINLR